MDFETVLEEEKIKNIQTSPVEFDAIDKTRETDEAVILPAILARECVSKYCNGRGYKPAAELRDAAFTLLGALVVPYNHIPTVEVEDRSVARGQVHDVAFDDQINAIRGDVWFLKKYCDETLLNQARRGTLPKDISCAYRYYEVYEPGVFGADAYDFKQINIKFGHVAVGVPEGRCPGPYCGFQVDTPEGFLKVNVRDPNLFCCRLSTLTVNANEGVYALVGKLKQNLLASGYAGGDALERDFLFEVSKGWTLEKAASWLNTHKDAAQFTTSIPGKPSLQKPKDARSKLDPQKALAESRKHLSNMFSTGDRP